MQYRDRKNQHNNTPLFKYKVIVNGQEIKEPQNYAYGFRGAERFFSFSSINELSYTFEGKRYLTRRLVYAASKTMENRLYSFSGYSVDCHGRKPLSSIRFVKIPIKDKRKQRTDEEREKRRELFIKTIENKIKNEESDVSYYRKKYKSDLKCLRSDFKRRQNNRKDNLKKLNKILSEV